MKHTRFLRLIAVSAALLLCVSSAQAQSWDFTSSDQGWKINDLTGSGAFSSTGFTFSTVHSSTGGNPGGFISRTDPTGNSFFFQSPEKLGDFSTYFGGTLNFSLRTDLTPNWSSDSAVLLKGNGNTLLVAALGYQPGVEWTQYSLSLLPQSFRIGSLNGVQATASDLGLVLEKLDSFLISGEYHYGIDETSGLSAVGFAAAKELTAVPEPSTYGLLGAAALAGLAALRRRRKA